MARTTVLGLQLVKMRPAERDAAVITAKSTWEGFKRRDPSLFPVGRVKRGSKCDLSLPSLWPRRNKKKAHSSGGKG